MHDSLQLASIGYLPCITVIHMPCKLPRFMCPRDAYTTAHPAFQRVHVLGLPAAVPTHTLGYLHVPSQDPILHLAFTETNTQNPMVHRPSRSMHEILNGIAYDPATVYP
jgi:hypothetical protein